ncbi:MAG: VanZ family protein [Actinomycetota bacterium]|nr:VanZ family protein [Actinomycetota bacterium]
MFLIALLRSHPLVAFAIGLTSSISIELLQRTLRPDRFSTVSDVVANALGTAMGIVIATAFSRRRV